MGHSSDVYLPTMVPFFDEYKLLVSQIKQGITHAIALSCMVSALLTFFLFLLILKFVFFRWWKSLCLGSE